MIIYLNNWTFFVGGILKSLEGDDGLDPHRSDTILHSFHHGFVNPVE